MPSPAALVSGYDSDSDHSENDAGPSSSSIAAPRSSGPATSSSGTFGLKLPPPSNTNTARPAAKRKADQRLQIKIDALDEEKGREATPQVKRPTMDKASSSSSHGLFGLLPAPSQKPAKPDVKAKAAAESAAADIADGVGAQEDEQPNKKAKGNNDFRAMLGLAPSAATKAKRPSPAPSPSPTSSKDKLPAPSLKSSQGKGTASESAQEAVRDRQGSGETTDFFSFGMYLTKSRMVESGC
ncbi:hypothetical protein FA10DRAFT_268343 [Acaromyces ingoldii]|uniref:Uncharacterized protein n=1 Tax=Acaromyces ingoldii TaxID=215250 RepID=A0A316YG66_9BASI|nr:hypothetical protein FA10DRAFT_268343 [Acaromyces ingoldii]PWN88121.1 hypothetical protein FA10DRAFT_268343 [Acaromyces ingoldii]